MYDNGLPINEPTDEGVKGVRSKTRRRSKMLRRCAAAELGPTEVASDPAFVVLEQAKIS